MYPNGHGAKKRVKGKQLIPSPFEGKSLMEDKISYKTYL